jgi:hypothetical protein
MILAIDPGPEQSATVKYNEKLRSLVVFGKTLNHEVAKDLRAYFAGGHSDPNDRPTLVVEMIASYGMPVGREVFDTCVWIGRFLEAWRGPSDTLYRGSVKLHLCGSMRAKDGNVRQALIDAFGGKEKAIGKKAQPGPLYGVSGDVWAALAVAVTYADRQEMARVA